MTFQNENSKMIDKTFDLQQIRNALIRYCITLTGSYLEAEDLAQDACLKGMPIIKGMNCHANPEAYLFKIAKNTWIDQIRKKRISAQVMNQFSFVDQPLEMVYSDIEVSLQILITHLSPLQRTVFLLREIFGISSIKAAKLLKNNRWSGKGGS